MKSDDAISLKSMSEITLDQAQLKELLKSALLELLQENRALFTDLIAEVMEDEGLYQAIQEVRHETPLSREAALAELENREGRAEAIH
jgi:hypothetical protein